MRKFLLTLVLLLTLCFTASAQEGRLVTELGDGFIAYESKTLIGGKDYSTTDVQWPALFLEDGNWFTGIRLTLVKIYGCETFKSQCIPTCMMYSTGYPTDGFPPHLVCKLDDGFSTAHVFELVDPKTRKTKGISIITFF